MLILHSNCKIRRSLQNPQHFFQWLFSLLFQRWINVVLIHALLKLRQLHGTKCSSHFWLKMLTWWTSCYCTWSQFSTILSTASPTFYLLSQCFQNLGSVRPNSTLIRFWVIVCNCAAHHQHAMNNCFSYGFCIVLGHYIKSISLLQIIHTSSCDKLGPFFNNTRPKPPYGR